MKRKRKARPAALPSKRARLDSRGIASSTSDITHPVLSRYYPRVVKLREWLLSNIIKASRKRRKAIIDYGKAIAGPDESANSEHAAAARLLDDVVVGFVPGEANKTSYYSEKKTFSQRSASLRVTDRSNSGQTMAVTSQMHEVRSVSIDTLNPIFTS